MGLGNGNPNEGNKGSNFNFELKMLQGLEAIANALDGGSGGGSGDPALNPGPALSSGVFNADDLIGFSDTNMIVGRSWGTYQKIGNIVSTDINIIIDNGISDSTGTIEVTLPVTVVGDVTSNARFVTGTMNVSTKIGQLLDSYVVAATGASRVTFTYAFNIVTRATVIRLHMTYVYNANIADFLDVPINL
jgi:hypothetical protein